MSVHMTLVPEKKIEQAEKIRKDIEEFKKNGGEIKRLKNGETEVQYNERKGAIK